MAITIETPTEDHWPAMFRIDARGFGWVPEEGDLDARRPIIDLTRFRIAVDRGEIVGVAGSYELDVTLPGGATAPISGVTWVSVAATHRRRGILTQMMDALHRDAVDRGEVAALLFASEGGIYERFGYGIATQLRSISIDRRAALFRSDLAPADGSVRYIEGDAGLDHRTRIWESYRRLRAGEVTRAPAWQEFITWLWSKPESGMSPAFCLAHDDGYAVYRIAEKWTDSGPMHRLDLDEIVALTPEAHLELWRTVVGIDLVATIESRGLPVDDPVPYWFTDNRVVRTTGLRDGMWANLLDVPTCFRTRTYGADDALVIESEGRRWKVEGDGSESSCRSVRTRPDLVVDQPTLGALLFGGVRPSQLVVARRATARNEAVLRRADAFFLTAPAPNCLTFF
ncbi:MAG: GNAT family N-acetyltransferase [Ilumatobacteraceae bacterium]